MRSDTCTWLHEIHRLRCNMAALPVTRRAHPRSTLRCIDLLEWVLLRCRSRWKVHLEDTRVSWKIWYGGHDFEFLIVGRVLSESTGPVVRINPYEVHINDPEFYDKLYVGASKGKTDKWFWSVSLPRGCGSKKLFEISIDAHVQTARRLRFRHSGSRQASPASRTLEPLLLQAICLTTPTTFDPSRREQIVHETSRVSCRWKTSQHGPCLCLCDHRRYLGVQLSPRL